MSFLSEDLHSDFRLCKIKNCTAMQILREINFWWIENGIFTIFDPMDPKNFENRKLQPYKISLMYQILISIPLKSKYGTFLHIEFVTSKQYQRHRSIIFGHIRSIFRTETVHFQNSKQPKMSKRYFLTFSTHQNWFHVKSELQ